MHTPHSRSVGGGNAPFSLVCQIAIKTEEEEKPLEQGQGQKGRAVKHAGHKGVQSGPRDDLNKIK